MLIINGNSVFDSDQGYIQNLTGNVRHPIGVNEITLLNFMVENVGRTLSKDELMYHVWQKRGIVVEMSSLMHCISCCRRALEDHSGEVIKTIRGEGYRFVGDIEKYYPSDDAPTRTGCLVDNGLIRIDMNKHTNTPKGRVNARIKWLALGLFICSALASYSVVENVCSPISDVSFEQTHFSTCWFSPDSSGVKVRYQDVNLYDFGELTLLVDQSGRSLSFRPKSGVLSCE
ncbi:hypothetical protein GCM10007938_04440 [Vibrio zhanjiangensis]|uniref:OmpR/PhoB-type domain-containing protein n=1 Tax=Vibrio zhanjiangensis TaxID=1046128 RepID=A0ABQ6EU41_9VIBR|nr:winged helix-turn-helix domain-containing protein [Vibrio zhanjiangensis]GLT16668.1 hypothetical protein GCM10007938_04440 [Vibrio zhanjiangensis]